MNESYPGDLEIINATLDKTDNEQIIFFILSSRENFNLLDKLLLFLSI